MKGVAAHVGRDDQQRRRADGRRPFRGSRTCCSKACSSSLRPALICGAFAERMKFSAMVLFSILWGTIVYCPALPLGVGRRHPGVRQRRTPSWAVRSTSPAARSCTSAPASRRWFVRCCSASGSASAKKTCGRTTSPTRRSAPPCCGSAGSASTPAASWRPITSPPALLRRRTSPPPRAAWPGPLTNG